MNGRERQRSRGRARRFVTIVLGTLGGVAILLAVALGLFRLAIAQIPEYQDEIKAWLTDELGFSVDFTELDAQLGFTGPELSLAAPSLGSGREFLQAARATITLDPASLLLARRIEISRLTLDGVRLTVERGADGVLRLGDQALAARRDGLAEAVPPSVEVAIRDSELRYVDALRGEVWTFGDLDVVVQSEAGAYVARLRMTPPAELADRLDLDLRLRLPPEPGDGDPLEAVVAVDVAGLDVATLARLVPTAEVWPLSGSGVLDARLRFGGTVLTRAEIGVALDDTTIGMSAPYEQLALRADWRRLDGGGWSLALDDVELRRAGSAWPGPVSAEYRQTQRDGRVDSVRLTTDFVRLGDLGPLVTAFPESQLAEQWALFEPTGDVADVAFELARNAAGFDYELDARFTGLTVAPVASTPGIRGIGGRVHATETAGTIAFSTGPFGLRWPLLFSDPVAGDSISGAVVWRQGRDTVQVLSADLAVGVLGRELRASFDLNLPRDGSSPEIDLEAELPAVDLVAAKAFVPDGILPDPLTRWIDRAVIGGEARNIELTLFGPLDAFPFDGGEGLLQVAADVDDVSLNYLDDWPTATAIGGRIEFENAGVAADATTGLMLGNTARAVTARMADVRSPVLTLGIDTEGALDDVLRFVRAAPLLAERLGPGFIDGIGVEAGTGTVHADLALPLTRLAEFEFDSTLRVSDGTVAVRGLGPRFTEIAGVVRADRETVTADSVAGVFVGGPITLSLARAEEPGYRARFDFEGETSASGFAEAFRLPQGELLEGQALWRGRVLLPEIDPLGAQPARISIESNLAGLAIRLPEPMAKPPGEPSNFQLNLSFVPDNRLEAVGNLGASRRFAMSFATGEDPIRFVRGAFTFGGEEPRLPVQAGIVVGGRIETLELDRWLALGDSGGIDRAGPLFLGADVEIASLHVFGQQLGSSALRVERGDDDWRIDIDSEAIAGRVVVPRDGARQRPVVAEMQRVYLATGGGGTGSGGLAADPRVLPPVRLRADEFGFGNRQLGAVSAEIGADPDGLILIGFSSETNNFATNITGSWLRRGDSSRTALNAQIRSSDVRAALAELGLDPVLDGESALVEADVHFDAAPSADWLDHLAGAVRLNVGTGTLREIDPGAGRVLGLMSIAALPRRLMLDFRDVFEQGFAFDEITGSFTLVDGNAYTNDLKFAGPAAEIGVVGRTGLRDRDYRQQIVVAPEPGKMLPTVGGLLGGAGVGAALLIFTRLFKEPLKSIGRASYCLTGSWEEPAVEVIDDDEPAQAESCADLPAAMRAELVDE